MKLAYSILKQKQFYSRVFFYSHLHSFWLGRKICPPPERVELGFIHGQQFWEGEKVLYSCEPGYWLIGSPERHCLKNGSWSGNQPSCIMPGNTYVYNLNRSLLTNKNQKNVTSYISASKAVGNSKSKLVITILIRECLQVQGYNKWYMMKWKSSILQMQKEIVGPGSAYSIIRLVWNDRPRG